MTFSTVALRELLMFARDNANTLKEKGYHVAAELGSQLDGIMDGDSEDGEVSLTLTDVEGEEFDLVLQPVDC